MFNSILLSSRTSIHFSKNKNIISNKTHCFKFHLIILTFSPFIIGKRIAYILHETKAIIQFIHNPAKFQGIQRSIAPTTDPRLECDIQNKGTESNDTARRSVSAIYIRIDYLDTINDIK